MDTQDAKKNQVGICLALFIVTLGIRFQCHLSMNIHAEIPHASYGPMHQKLILV